jgi:hypothetical protein
MTSSGTSFTQLTGMMIVTSDEYLDEVIEQWVNDLKARYPYSPCREPYAGFVAGDPVCCTLRKGHAQEKHYNHELHVWWWGKI